VATPGTDGNDRSLEVVVVVVAAAAAAAMSFVSTLHSFFTGKCYLSDAIGGSRPKHWTDLKFSDPEPCASSRRLETVARR
jgi:hypothetical protein